MQTLQPFPNQYQYPSATGEHQIHSSVAQSNQNIIQQVPIPQVPRQDANNPQQSQFSLQTQGISINITILNFKYLYSIIFDCSRFTNKLCKCCRCKWNTI